MTPTTPKTKALVEEQKEQETRPEEQPERPEHPAPSWCQEFTEAWRSGKHFYALTGPVYDYEAQTGIENTQYFAEYMSQKYSIILIYNMVTGFRFGPPTLEESGRHQALCILDPDRPLKRDSKADAMNAALAKAAGEAVQKETDVFDQQMSTFQALQLIQQLMLTESDQDLQKDENGNVISRPRSAQDRVLVIIEKADLLCPRNEMKSTMSPMDKSVLGLLFEWGHNMDMQLSGNTVVLLSSELEDLHADLLESGMFTIDIPLPSLEERTAYIKGYMKRREDEEKDAIPFVDLDLEEVAVLSAGLSLTQVEDIILRGSRAGIKREHVLARKKRIIEEVLGDSAEMIDPLDEGFAALGGMDELVDWMRDDIILPIRRGSRDVPKGVLLVGPPGTGKTFLLRALARELGFPAIMINTENLVGSLMGESEKKMRKLLRFIRALTPCLAFCDEIDQAFQRNQGSGNSVGANQFSQLLRLLSDETLRGKFIFFCASNAPELIDPALLRFGRMDRIIPVLLPNELARLAIIIVQARTQQIAISEQAAKLAASNDRTRDYSAADLAAVVAKGKGKATKAGHAEITVKDIELALSLILPSTPKIALEYTLKAIRACNDAEFLPVEYRPYLKNRDALDEKIEQVEKKPARTTRREREW